MKRAMRVCAVVALAAMLASGAGCDRGVRLTDEDDGSSVALAQGEVLELVLTSNPTTGYAWSVAEIPDCLEQEGASEYDSDAPPGMMGAGGEETWRFSAVAPGDGVLRLEYARPWESDEAAPDDVYEVEVTVE